ncbi:hypothetical protein T484DRAFT_1860263 [Baffinella frigidus]|nr:hypothetical protein T484DRAFT_1860263 [Cryptophyta sp. CCMP2293]
MGASTIQIFGREIFGREVSFGYAAEGATGVFEVPPRCASGVMPRVTYKESVVMGYVFRSPVHHAYGYKESVVMGYIFRSRYEVDHVLRKLAARFRGDAYHLVEVDHVLRKLAARFRGDAYHLVEVNCNHFANELSLSLVGKKIPSFVNRPANVGRNVLKFFAGPAKVVEKIAQFSGGAEGTSRSEPSPPTGRSERNLLFAGPAKVVEKIAQGVRKAGQALGS